MFKNWFKSTNEKRMEEQIAKLREDVNVLQAKMNEWINTKLTIEEEKTVLDNILVQPTLDTVLEPRIEDTVLEPTFLEKEELVAVVVDPSSILETPITHSLESLIMKEEPISTVELVEKVLEPVATVELVEKVLEPVATVEPVEKVLEPVATVEKEKETNIVPPKKRRQSKKAAQLEEALPKLIV